MFKTFNLRHKVDIRGQLTMLKLSPLPTFVFGLIGQPTIFRYLVLATG